MDDTYIYIEYREHYFYWLESPPLNFSFYLNYYKFFFFLRGNIFWELKKFSGTNDPVVSTPAFWTQVVTPHIWSSPAEAYSMYIEH